MGGCYRAFGSKLRRYTMWPKEGTEPRSGRMIIFQFPTEAAADAWFNDPEYQALSEYRRAGADTKSITMVHTLPPRK